MKKISVILPTRNEELLLDNAISQIVSFLNKRKTDYEVLIVINGSADKSASIAKEHSTKNKKVKVLSSKPGYGHALRKGLKESKGEYIAIFNVDFFDLHMLDLAIVNLAGKDMAIGSKRTYWASDSRPLSRKTISWILNTFLKILFKFSGSDTHGIKIVSRKVLQKILPKCKTESGIFDTEFVIRAQKEGFQIFDYPVEIKEKRTSRFTNRFWQTPKDLYNLWQALKND